MKRCKQTYNACSIEARDGKLRLRYRALPAAIAQGSARQPARVTGLADTPENRARLQPIAEVVGKLLAAGQDPTPTLDNAIAPRRPRRVAATPATSPVAPAPDLGPTVEQYYKAWLPAQQPPRVRVALAHDYKRHFDDYIIPRLAPIPLAELRTKDVRALQAELLARKQAPRKDRPETATLGVKTVKNVIAGSLRAMIRQAVADELVTRDVFAGLTWPEWVPPEADPFEVDEVRRIGEWFARTKFGFPPAKGSKGVRRLLHPSFHAYVHTLFHTGLRPSEASGLQWQDIDLAGGRLYVRRSFHLYGYNNPKTKSARRTVQLLDETVRVLRALQPANVAPDTPVFVNTTGGPIEPKSFSEHFQKAQKELGIRVRGLYCTKKTYVSHALQTAGNPLWVEQQTGVAYATLKRHYARWMPSGDRAEVQRLALRFAEGANDAAERVEEGAENPDLCPSEEASRAQSSQDAELEENFECEEGDLNPHGCYPTSPSN